MTDLRPTDGPDAHPDVLVRWLAGEAAPEEVRLVESWAAADPTLRRELDVLTDAVARLRQTQPADLDVEAALRRVRNRINEGTAPVLTRPRWHQHMGIRGDSPLLKAAAVLLVTGGATLLWRNIQSREHKERGTSPVASRTISTGIGQRDSLTLPDGTRVTLGPSSTLTFASDFGSAARRVDLTGEAYFDVKHDATREFMVHTRSATIRDIGTTFDVQTTGAADVRVAVTSGSVLLKGNAGTQDSVVLGAGDVGVTHATGHTSAQRAAVTDANLAWLRGKLIFRDTPLTEAAEQIRRWYGVELSIADPALRNQHLTATFDGEPKAQVLRTIALALGAEIELRGDTAILHKHGF